jgi:predicted flap endonuclease-1-like 5' DNA nuclease
LKIEYVAPARGVTCRLVGPYRWDKTTGYVQDVDAETAASLLTQPPSAFAPVAEFAIDAGEMLLTIKGLGVPQAGELALLGVGSVRELALLSAEGIGRVAAAMAMSDKQMRAWVNKAKNMMA